MSIPGIDCVPCGAPLVSAAGLSHPDGTAGIGVAESGFADGMVMPGIASAAGAAAGVDARRGAGRCTGFFAAGLFAGFAGAGFLAGAGIFMPGMPGMSRAAAGMASTSAVVAASAASRRFMPRLRAGAR